MTATNATKSAAEFLDAVAIAWDSLEPWQNTARHGLSEVDEDALSEMCDRHEEGLGDAAEEVMLAVRAHVLRASGRTPEEIGAGVGRAMAAHVLREGLTGKDAEWDGLMDADVEAMGAAGLSEQTPEWDRAEAAAEAAYRASI